MNRFETVANMQPGVYEIKAIAELLVQFVDEALTENSAPLACPAVRFLGLQLSFLCHGDVYTDPSGASLRQRCMEVAAARAARQQEVH